MSDDATLLRRYVEECSEAAFADLVGRHIGLVYGAALRQLGGAVHRAQDVTQSVFIDLARNARSLSRRGEIGSWLYTSTHYAAAKLKRSEQRRAVREQEAQRMQETTSGASADVDWEQLGPVLDDALLAMRERDREVLLLRFFQGRRFIEVGERMGLSEDAARMRVDRALEKLRALLSRRGIPSTSAALGAALANQTAAAAPVGLVTAITAKVMAGAGPTATTGILMSTSIFISGIVAVAALGTTAYQTHRAHTAEQATVAAARASETLRARAMEGQQRAIAAENRVAALLREIDTARATRSAAASGTPVAGSAVVPSGDLVAAEKAALDVVAKEIEGRKGVRASRSVVDVRLIDTGYRGFYRQVNFSPEQIARFKVLVAENASRHQELDKLAATRGLKVDDPAMQPMYRQTDAEFEARIAESFGPAAMHTLRHYGETLPARGLVEQMASRLFYSDAPLNAQQADQLVEILWNTTIQGKMSVAAFSPDVAIAQGEAVLLPPQHPCWRELVRKMAEGKARAEGATASVKPAGK